MTEKDMFGFGPMRMYVTNPDDPASFDFDKIEKLFDSYVSKGFTYFDTAYTYHGYQTEKAVKRAVVDCYPS